MRVFLIAIAVLLLGAAPARAAGVLERASDTLRLDPIYVDPDAQQSIEDSEGDDLRAQIADDEAAPLYIALLPAAAADEANGSPAGALAEIVRDVREPGVYAAIVGGTFVAGATEGQLPRGVAQQLAQASLASQRGKGTERVLSDFVARVGRARTGESGAGGADDDVGGDDGGGGGGWIVVALIALAGAGVAVTSRRRRRNRQEAALAGVRAVARDDVVTLGEEIRALDLDMEMPDADPQAKQHYGRAVELYGEADAALSAARRPGDLGVVAERLEEGRWEMEAARAAAEGRPIPERRPPCFFDPRHGPSTTEAEWAPPGGQPRPVPVCAADATRLADGEEPHTRLVPTADGGERPLWEAGRSYAPYAGGFFGMAGVPSFFAGALLGGGLFGGWGWDDDASADEGDGGDGGDGDGDGGDFGDFGDFGGGDFGGGDFGGGGGDF